MDATKLVTAMWSLTMTITAVPALKKTGAVWLSVTQLPLKYYFDATSRAPTAYTQTTL